MNVKKGLLTKYERLLKKYGLSVNEVSLNEVADTMICSLRYAREIIKELQSYGWVRWHSSSGRGARSFLQCFLDSAGLKANLTNSLVHGGFDSCTKTSMIETSNDSLTLDIHNKFIIYSHGFFTSLKPTFHVSRAERHLVSMMHVGLMRYSIENSEPIPGLAHSVECNTSLTKWTFHLRHGLRWHNGEPVLPEQILSGLSGFVNSPALPYLKSVDLSGLALNLHLTQPDTMLLDRLALPALAFAHPAEEYCGLGPFMLSSINNERIALKRSPFWFGEYPLTEEIIWETSINSQSGWSHIRLEIPNTLKEEFPVNRLETCDSFAYLTYNRKQSKLNDAQTNLISNICDSLVANLKECLPDMNALEEWLTPPPVNYTDVSLPKSVTIACFNTSEILALADALKKSLMYRGCSLDVVVLNPAHWFLCEQNWSRFDLCIGLLRFGHEPLFSIEGRYRHTFLWPSFWDQKIWSRGIRQLNRSVKRSRARHLRNIKRFFGRAMRSHMVRPLFSQRYILEAPAVIRGIHLQPQGWPDFCRLWIDQSKLQ